LAKEELIEMNGVVQEVLPDSRFLVEMENGHSIVAYTAGKMRKHHIRRTDNILLYDTNGFFSVARVALMFRYFGANRVRIINGGLKKWKLEGKPVFEGDYVPGEGLDAEGDYNYHVVDEGIFVRDIDTVHKAARQVFVGDKSVQILDARPHVLTYGGTPGRPGFLSGHITGSKNLFA